MPVSTNRAGKISKPPTQEDVTQVPNLEVRDLPAGDPFRRGAAKRDADVSLLYNPEVATMEVNPRSESGFVTHVTFFGHFRCPSERLEGTAETHAAAETRP